MQRERIDKLLVDHGLAPSRTKAQALVMAGVVLVDEQLVHKPSEAFAIQANIRLKGAGDPASRYVGRGGVKLEAALRDFRIEVAGSICLDVGASTGGFTDCLLSGLSCLSEATSSRLSSRNLRLAKARLVKVESSKIRHSIGG